ncbi:MAG: dihydroorotate dehydrogenase (quinone), partial [Pseudomonadota bacterium]
DLALIGVGGVSDGATAAQKLMAGADLVQLYTGMIYGGPGIIGHICDGLSKAVDDVGVDNAGALTGIATDEWANRPVPED